MWNHSLNVVLSAHTFSDNECNELWYYGCRHRRREHKPPDPMNMVTIDAAPTPVEPSPISTPAGRPVCECVQYYCKGISGTTNKVYNAQKL